MLVTIGEFKDKVQFDMDALITDLQFLTGRYGQEEQDAWRASLPKVAKAFTAKSFDNLHLYFGGRGQLALEYQLPAAAAWCDIVLLGRHQEKPAAVFVELKNWTTRADRPGPAEGLMERQGIGTLHPSDQVRGYTEYCRRFHSAVQDYGADVNGCVLFTNDHFVNAYRQPPNDALASQYPCFTMSPDDVAVVMPGYFAQRLTGPDEQFARAFEDGEYRQDRGFVSQIGRQILDPENSPFELLDHQRRAFSLCKANIDFALFGEPNGPTKKAIIIHGPPGSGKSVIAARLWADLVTNDRLQDGGVVFTTTSASQSSNWSHLFVQAAHDRAGVGVVKKATGYTPVTTHRLGRLRETHGDDFLNDATNWRTHVSTLRALGERFSDGARDDQYLVSIVDEAHALINPEHKAGRGQFGFVVSLGPQAYHIMRASTITVFLLDVKQGYRDRENTTVEDIKLWAEELGVTLLEPISLEGSQFRCAGSRDYVDWIESVLAGHDVGANQDIAKTWYHASETLLQQEIAAPDYPKVAEPGVENVVPFVSRTRRQGLDFRVFDNPAQMEDALRERMEEGATARLLASYAREWKTRDAAVPHDMPANMQDFYEPYTVNGQQQYWHKVWNFVPRGSDYTYYIQARPGSRMFKDPLCEVGCPYAVRGFDFGYIGLLWLNDLKWRDGRWVVDKNHVFETGVTKTLNAARREANLNGPENARLREAVQQSYRILLTRAMKGVYIWFEDETTRVYIEESIG